MSGDAPILSIDAQSPNAMSPQEADGVAPVARPGSELLISLIAYLLTMLSMASIGILLPIAGDLARTLGVPASEIGATIAYFSIPSALGSILVGQLCDRFGTSRILLAGGALAILADLSLFLAPSPALLAVGTFITGIAFAAIVVSAPALLIARLDGTARSRALSLWSTYAAVGISAGLLLGAPFAGQSFWRQAILLHAALLLAALVAAMVCFRGMDDGPRPNSGAAARSSWAMLRHIPVLRLAVAMALPNAISYGTSLLAPSYITATHHVSIASAATAVALAKIVVVLSGGLFSGWVLARAISPRAMFVALVVLGLVGQLALFHPQSGFALALAGLGIWLFCYSAIAAIIMALLPVIFDRPSAMGAASGLVSQATSCASFVAPILYFTQQSWSFFPTICAIGMAAAAIILPSRPRREDGAPDS